jgi:hypothetical protein
VKGIWEPLVPRATFLAVQHILSAPERRTSRPGRANHLLSMIARCGECGGKLAARVRDGRSVYYCHAKGCQQIPEVDLDELAEGAILDYLSQPDRHKALTERGNGPELDTAREAVAEIQTELNDLADRVGAGKLSQAFAERTAPGIEARLKVAQKRKDELETPSRLRGLIKPGEDVQSWWEAAPMETRREVARIMFAPDLLGELRLRRAPRGTLVGDRVEMLTA